MFIAILCLIPLMDAATNDSSAIERATTTFFDNWKAGKLKESASVFVDQSIPVIAIHRLGKSGLKQVSLTKWLQEEKALPESVVVEVEKVSGPLAVARVKFKVIQAHQAYAVITYSNADGNGWKIISMVFHYDRIW
jgi:hypothetical protein